MKKIHIKPAIALLITTLPFAASYADPIYNKGAVKTYTIRVTSLNPNASTQIYGSIMNITNKNTTLNAVTGVNTPYEITTNSVGVSEMLMSDNDIKVDVIEKDGGQEKTILSGYGKNIVSACDSSNTNNYIYTK